MLALDKDEDVIVKKAARKMEQLKSRALIRQKEKKKARVSLRSPMSDHRRPYSKSQSESGAISKTDQKVHQSSITFPFPKDEDKMTKKWRPKSDQGARDNEDEGATSQEKSLTFNRFFRTPKRKEAWDPKK